MDFSFPIYPFIWNYNDMYQIVDLIIYDEIEFDENIINLLKIFPNYKIINIKQNIKKEEAKNLCFHTFVLYNLNIFQSINSNIKIITNKKINYKTNITALIYDPNDIFERIINKNRNIVIIKKLESIKLSIMPKIYIYIHNINNILRFSPKDNSNICIKNNGIFYIILDKLIIKFNIYFND